MDRLAWVHQVPRVTYANGDQSDYLDLTFRCTWLSGDPYPADGEMSSVDWYRIEPDTLLRLDDDIRQRVARALADEREALFEGGR